MCTKPKISLSIYRYLTGSTLTTENNSSEVPYLYKHLYFILFYFTIFYELRALNITESRLNISNIKVQIVYKVISEHRRFEAKVKSIVYKV